MCNRERDTTLFYESPIITIGKVNRVNRVNKVNKVNKSNQNDSDEFLGSSKVVVKIGRNRKASCRSINSRCHGSTHKILLSDKSTSSVNSSPDDFIVEVRRSKSRNSFSSSESGKSNESDKFSNSDSDSDSDSEFMARKKYTTKKQYIKLSKKIEETREKNIALNDLISKFNTVMMGIITHLIKYYGDSETVNLKYIFMDIMNRTPDEPISYFILNVYKNDEYRYSILEQSDKLFTDHSQNDINKMFEFKKVWKQMDNETKKFIKKSMMVLVKICEKYVLRLTNVD